jgi:hypothetical protein
MAKKISKSESLKRYRNRLDHAKRWREETGLDKTWERMLDLYKGKHFPKGIGEEDRIAINIAFSTINVIFPSITVNHPKIEVMANRPADEDRAVITESVINYWWRHYNFRTPFRRAAKDFLTVGHGWIKVGYKFAEGEEELSEGEKRGQFEEMVSQADEYAMENPEMANEVPTDEEIAANVPESKMVILEDQPYLERVSPFDMFVDPEATSLEDAKWIAQRIIRPIEEVKEDSRYNGRVRRDLKADAVLSSDWLTQDQKRKVDSDIQRVTVWEFYDLQRETISVFAEGGDDFLIDPQEMPYEFGHPYEFIANYEIPDEFYPIGDLEMIEAPQQELNKTRSQMMNHRKKYGRKYLYRASALGPEGRQGLESNEDNVAIEVVDDNQPLGDVILPVPITPMSGDLYQYSQIIEADMDKVSGVNEYARGATPEVRRTATEAAMIQDASNARSADKLALIELAIGNIARKIVQLAQQYMTGEQAARIVGAEGQQFWFDFTPDDIEGEFDFQVEGGSTQPQNDTFRRQQAVAMMNSLAPLIGSVIDPQQIAKHVLQFGFGIKSPGKFMMPPPPPMAMGPDGQPMPQDPNAMPMGPDAGMGPPKGEPGMNGEQMNPMDLLAAQNAGGMEQAGMQPAPQTSMSQTGQGGLPPELLAQLQNQMGLQL